jgi:hypothetical protein
MEPSGRNQSQLVANGRAARTAETGESVAVAPTGCRGHALASTGD